MNFRYVISQLGLLFIVFSAIKFVMAIAFYGSEWIVGKHPVEPASRNALLLSGLAGLVIGLALWRLPQLGVKAKKANTLSAVPGAVRQLGRREALLLVGGTWIIGAAYAALPFFLWAHLADATELGRLHPFRSFVNCYFEAMSGLSTTGATVLADIEAVPRSLLLWRSTTQWLGGLGIIVLFVAVLPMLGVGAKRLYRSEMSGVSKEGVQPHIRDTARILWLVYLGFTVVEIIALRIAGMDWYHSINHTFCTIATGGFSPKTASVGAYYDNPAILIIITIFMALGGVNFALYYHFFRGRVRTLFKDTELRVYLAAMTIGVVLIAAALLSSKSAIVMTNSEEVDPTAGTSILHAMFNGVSMMTTTGFASADYDRWPFLAHAVLIIFMFLGGCAGSTAGGIKIIRIWIVLKVLYSELERAFRPSVIRPVRIGRSVIDSDVKIATLGFVLGVVLLFVLGSLTIMLTELANHHTQMTYETSATATLATLQMIGPGFGEVGPTRNYEWFSAPSKIVMCLLMALGRLEIFAIIVLFTPRFWRGT